MIAGARAKNMRMKELNGIENEDQQCGSMNAP
jgi:hypothetical protein